MDIKANKPSQRRLQQPPAKHKKSTRPRRRTDQDAQTSVAAPAAVINQKKFLLPRYAAPDRPKRVVKKYVSKKMLIIRMAIVCAIVLLATGGFLSWKAYHKFHQVFHGKSTVAALANKTVTPNLLKGEGDGRVNIVLLGIGGPGHDGPDLTDTIMVLSVDPVNNTATMLSIPRDLWVKQPVNYFGSYQKINAAYESGKYEYLGQLDSSNANTAAIEAGFNSLDQVIENVFDININYHLLVNFQAFRQAIDAVGGITVNVPTPLVDQTMAWENHGSPILASAGVQQMDGVKALLYARSRETTSDFARGQRQRQIIIALKDKIMTAGTLSNPTKLVALMNAFGDNVYSDLSTQGAMRLVSIMKNIGDKKIDSISLTDSPHQLITTDHVGTASVDRPVAGFYNYTDIQNYVHSQMTDGYIVKEHAAITVASVNNVTATTTATLLKTYGYNITATATSSSTILKPILVNLSKGKDPYTLHYLENRYDIKAITQLPSGLDIAPGSAKFVIIEP